VAKLAARGRAEVYRVHLHREPAQGRPYDVTRTLMSDGNILEKITFMSADNRIDRITGWTVRAKLEKSETAEQWLSKYMSKNWERA
jgi:hypothetical protein